MQGGRKARGMVGHLSGQARAMHQQQGESSFDNKQARRSQQQTLGQEGCGRALQQPHRTWKPLASLMASTRRLAR